MTDDAERNGRVRDSDGIIGNDEYENRDDGLTDGVEDYVEGRMENGSTLAVMRFFNEKRAFLSARFIL